MKYVFLFCGEVIARRRDGRDPPGGRGALKPVAGVPGQAATAVSEVFREEAGRGARCCVSSAGARGPRAAQARALDLTQNTAERALIERRLFN